MDEDEIVETVLDLVKDDIPLKIWERFYKDCETYTKGTTVPEISGNVSGGEYIPDNKSVLIYGLLEGEEFELPLDQADNFLRFLRDCKVKRQQAIKSHWGPFRKRLKFTKNKDQI